MITSSAGAGPLLRQWRLRRRRSQLDLALGAKVSQRHLSFIESGRSTAGRDVLLRLAEELDVPLRARNALLLAAGYAPVYPEGRAGDAATDAVRSTVRRVLAAHGAWPALAADRHWHLVDANDALQRLVASADPSLLQPPANVLRLSLHPDGLADRVVNYTAWRAHVLARLDRDIELTADPTLVALRGELAGYRAPAGATREAAHGSVAPALAVPLLLRTPDAVLSFISATTVFGTALDVGLSELTIETFLPADDATAMALLRSHEPGAAPLH